MRKEKNQLKPIDAPSYGYWSALYRSFYSRHLYVDVGKCWRGWGLLYLLLAIAIYSIPFAAKMNFNFNVSFKEQLLKPLINIPTFYIQDGNVVFDKPMPYFVKNDKGDVTIIIDTTGQINDFSKYPLLAILVNKNKMSMKIPTLQLFDIPQAQFSSGSPIVQEFTQEDNAVFDGKTIAKEQTITNLKYFAQMLIYPIIVSIFFSMLVTFFFVFAFLGQIFSSVFFSFSIRLKQSCRLLIVSGTPMLLLMMLLLTFNCMFTGSGFILLFLLISYFSYGLYALRAESKKIVS